MKGNNNLLQGVFSLIENEDIRRDGKTLKSPKFILRFLLPLDYHIMHYNACMIDTTCALKHSLSSNMLGEQGKSSNIVMCSLSSLSI